jgi:hypothetical protein
MRIFLDIETIPSQDEAVYAEIQDEVQPPANMKKAETIERWEAEEKPAAVEERWRKTALSGDRGEVVAIGWAVDDSPIHVAHRSLNEPESQVLADFFEIIGEHTNQPGKPATPQWVGHNVKDFDLRFLFQRAVVTGIKPSVPLPHDARPGAKEVFDTMTAWAGFGNRISLDRLCTALGIPGKDGMDGSVVWDYIRDGREDEVAEYCRADVERTRQVFHRLTFGNFRADQAA